MWGPHSPWLSMISALQIRSQALASEVTHYPKQVPYVDEGVSSQQWNKHSHGIPNKIKLLLFNFLRFNSGTWPFYLGGLSLGFRLVLAVGSRETRAWTLDLRLPSQTFQLLDCHEPWIKLAKYSLKLFWYPALASIPLDASSEITFECLNAFRFKGSPENRTIW